MRHIASFFLTFALISSSFAAPTTRPNILFAIADDATWSHFSAYGCRFVSTPTFDRVAREGILFNNCFTPTPKCSPSRAAILTGKNPWQLEEAADHYGAFNSKFTVFPDLLERAGYFVGYTGKGWGPGNFKIGGFKRNPAGPIFEGATLDPPTPDISPKDYAANFERFLRERPKGSPFYFWYGGHEPHRKYAAGSGLKAGKKLSDVVVPAYLPDTDVVRSDLLDYALEIEWFDAQLGRMLKMLEDAGELDDTLVVVTADNGLPFPRAKGHIYDDGFHEPLAIRWPRGIPKDGRVLNDFVSFIDFAPTFLEAAGVAPPPDIIGQSLMNILTATPARQIDSGRDHVLVGRERNDLGRPGNVGYPVRGIRTAQYLYTRNFAPERWPCGDPETGYTDTDDSPTKQLLIDRHAKGSDHFFDLAMAKRGAEELYDITKDPACVKNLADDPSMSAAKGKLWETLQRELREQNDPRTLGNGDVFDHYKSYGMEARSWDAVMRRKTTAPAK